MRSVCLLVLCLLAAVCGAEVSLWPYPQQISHGTGSVSIANGTFKFVAVGKSSKTLTGAFDWYTDIIFQHQTTKIAPGSAPLQQLAVSVTSDSLALQLGTDESYSLNVDAGSAVLSATTVYGALRGLETFSQLVTMEDGSPQITCIPVSITDKPRFPHRGVLLDTARAFYPVEVIKHLIDSLAFNKMNVFHWHIVDSQAFPVEVKSFPKLTFPYSPSEVYSHADIAAIVSHGLARGVRVVPEFDTPGHTYAWGVGYPELTVCGDIQPWGCCCAEPPCGQLDPSQNFTYQVLEGLLGEMSLLFSDNVFHTGADEVNFACWNTSSRIKAWMKEEGFTTFDQILNYFEEHEQAILRKNKKTPMTWQEAFSLGSNISMDTIVQVWLDLASVEKVVQSGRRAVVSTYQHWYLDCGYGNWLTGGDRSWCDPFKNWKTMYDLDPANASWPAHQQDLVLGGEAAMWSEQCDPTTLDMKVWPRASAVAERLWSPRSMNNATLATARINAHRDRLVQRGVHAAPLQPRWCVLHPESCSLPAESLTHGHAQSLAFSEEV